MRSVSLLPLVLTAACVGDVGEGKVDADVQAPSQARQAPDGDLTVLQVAPAESTIRALGAKVTATHPVDFHRWQGTVTLSGDQLVDVDFTVDVGSLESDHPKLTKHLKAEDFLHVEKFPQARFDGTSITAGSDAEGMTHTVTGNLSIRGKTLGVTFPAKVELGADAVSAKTEFVIDRQDFDVRYPGSPDNLVQDNVVLTVELVAPRALEKSQG